MLSGSSLQMFSPDQIDSLKEYAHPIHIQVVLVRVETLLDPNGSVVLVSRPQTGIDFVREGYELKRAMMFYESGRDGRPLHCKSRVNVRGRLQYFDFYTSDKIDEEEEEVREQSAWGELVLGPQGVPVFTRPKVSSSRAVLREEGYKWCENIQMYYLFERGTPVAYSGKINADQRVKYFERKIRKL